MIVQNNLVLSPLYQAKGHGFNFKAYPTFHVPSANEYPFYLCSQCNLYSNFLMKKIVNVESNTMFLCLGLLVPLK